MNRRKFIYNSSIASLSVMGLQSCNILDRNVKISILHTNDVHSQIEAFPFNHNIYPDRGGFAKRANIFKGLIKINPNTLIFDAGDIFQGTPYFNFFQGELELNLMKKMGYPIHLNVGKKKIFFIRSMILKSFFLVEKLKIIILIYLQL